MEEPISNYNEPTLSHEDMEIKRLQKENDEKRNSLEKQREIDRLIMESKKIEMQSREVGKRSGSKFNFDKDKAKFWAIASVIAIAAAVIIVKIAQKLF